MNDYFTPDPIWSIYKIENQDDYVNKNVIKGNFHSGVHNDVINTFKTVEYLMAHAYYHYEIYDQVLVKILSIFEMAVKLRSREINNPLQFQTKKGRTQEKKLVQLIDELKNFGYPAYLIRELHWLRNLRNNEVHQDRHSFAGVIKKAAVIPGINIINRLFLEPDILTLQEEKNTLLLKNKVTFSNDVFNHSYDHKNILIHDLEFIANVELEPHSCQYWKASPIMTDAYTSVSNGNFGTPIIFFLKDVRIENGNVIATDFHTNESITLQKTTAEEAIQAYQTHLDGIAKTEPILRFGLDSSYRHHSHTHLEEFIYTNCWTE